MENRCPICRKKVQDWQMCAGKTTIVDSLVVHNSCLQDFKQSTNKDWSRWEIAEELSGGGLR